MLKGIPPVRRLVMHRARGLVGPFYQQVSQKANLHSTGAYYAPNGPGAGVRAYAGTIVDATHITIFFSGCVDISAVTGIEYKSGDGDWTEVTSVTGSGTTWTFETGTLDPLEFIQWQAADGSIVDCVEAESIGAQGPLTMANVLLPSGDLLLLEDALGTYLFEDGSETELETGA